jgi:hypothetical protein
MGLGIRIAVYEFHHSAAKATDNALNLFNFAVRVIFDMLNALIASRYNSAINHFVC